MIAERVKAGMARAKKQGKRLGRPRAVNGEWATIHPLIQNGTLSQPQAASRLGVSKTTIHRLLVHNGGGNRTPQVSEVLGLDRDQILRFDDPVRARLRITRKGPKEQILPITQDARQALLAWLAVRPEVPTEALFFRIPFQSTRRDRLHYASIEKILKRYAASAGVPIPEGIAFHHLRHTAGQQMSELGMGIEEAQQFLGHADPKTTLVYYAVSDKRLQRVAQRLRYEPPESTPEF